MASGWTVAENRRESISPRSPSTGAHTGQEPTGTISLASCLKAAHHHSLRARQHHPALGHCCYPGIMKKALEINLLFFLPQINARIPVTFGEELGKSAEMALYITLVTTGRACRARTAHTHPKRGGLQKSILHAQASLLWALRSSWDSPMKET